MTPCAGSLHELWTETVAAGSADLVVEARRRRAETARAAGDGELLAGWSTEFGQVEELLTLWTHPAGAELTVPIEDPTDGLLRRRERRLLRAERPVRTDFHGGHLYDFRCYSLQPGTRSTFLAHMLPALMVRERFSRCVGVWTPLTGEPDQVIHIWGYRDLAERDRARQGVGLEQVWRDYLRAIFPMVRQMSTALLLPLAFSPAR